MDYKRDFLCISRDHLETVLRLRMFMAYSCNHFGGALFTIKIYFEQKPFSTGCASKLFRSRTQRGPLMRFELKPDALIPSKCTWYTFSFFLPALKRDTPEPKYVI